MKTLLLLLLRLAMICTAAGIMYLEGRATGTPGVWFVVAMALVAVAVLPWRGSEQHG
jgi:hypothetical protein